MRFFLVIWVTCCALSTSRGQEILSKKDSLPDLKADTLITNNGRQEITIETYAARFNPRKAILYSAVLPGLGQVYNKKYWKLPIVYSGFFGLVYAVTFYNSKATLYRNDLFDLLNGETSAPNRSPLGFQEPQLRSLIDRSERERDFFMILSGFFYLLQMVDAHVDAHLKEFELNPKLKVRIEPLMERSYYTGTSTGIAIKFRF